MDIINRNQLAHEFRLELEEINKITRAISSGSLSSTIDNKLVKLTPLEFVFAYTSISQRSNKITPYRKPLIDLFKSLESASPGSAFIAANILLSKEIEEASLDVKMNKRQSSSRIFSTLSFLMSHEEHNVVKAIIESGGLCQPSCFEQLDCGNHYVIKSASSGGLSLKIERDFKSIPRTKLANSIVICADSVFETMSEIDELVRWSQDIKAPIILIARGFLPEVTSTLYHNYLNGKLKVFPCTVGFSDDDPFNLDDVSKMCGTTTIQGPLSIYDNDALSRIAGEVLGGTIDLGALVIIPKSGLVDIGTVDLENLDSKRMERVLSGVIKVSVPKNATILQKSRISKGILLYRQHARELSVSIDNFKYPVPLSAYTRILRSVDHFFEGSKKIALYIKDQDGMAI